MLGLVDDAHAAGAEPVEDAVIAEHQAERLAGEEAVDLVVVEPAAADQGFDEGGGVAVVQAGVVAEEGVQLAGAE